MVHFIRVGKEIRKKQRQEIEDLWANSSETKKLVKKQFLHLLGPKQDFDIAVKVSNPLFSLLLLHKCKTLGELGMNKESNTHFSLLCWTMPSKLPALQWAITGAGGGNNLAYMPALKTQTASQWSGQCSYLQRHKKWKREDSCKEVSRLVSMTWQYCFRPLWYP